MSDDREIRNVVRSYILDSFLSREDGDTLRDEDDLLLVLDSLQILRMLIALESKFAIKVEDGDLTPDNIGSVKKLAATIARKQGADTPMPQVVRP